MVAFVCGTNPLAITWKTDWSGKSKGVKTELFQELTRPEADWWRPEAQREECLGVGSAGRALLLV